MTSTTVDAQLETAIKNTFTGDKTAVKPPKETKPSTKKPKENNVHKTGNITNIIAEKEKT